VEGAVVTIALDVAIGVVFLYLLLALIVTTVQELIASFFRLRAKHLYDAIAGMLEGTAGPETAAPPLRQLFEHPLIRNLANEALRLDAQGRPSLRGIGLPSYIPSQTFALALIDVLRGKQDATTALGASQVLAEAASTIEALPKGSQARKALALLLNDAKALGGNVDEQAKLVSRRIESWFNDRMARASGWYKRKAQVWSLAIALGVTLAANADTIHVVNRLWSDAALRAAVVASAQKFAAVQPAPSSASAAESDPVAEARSVTNRALQQTRELESSYLPVGWKWELKSASSMPCVRLDTVSAEVGSKKPIRCWAPSWRDYGLLAVGWLITALAVSLGAAFWFDVLSKALQLRGSGPRVSETSGKVEAS
jgi:hypothetical protein